MLLNDAKGSSGMFSRAGRYSADKYHILNRKDEIINGNNKKIKLPDIFTPDENLNKADNIEDEIDIFATKTQEKENTDVNFKITKKGPTKKLIKPNDEIAKYLEMKKKKQKTIEMPSCTKYNPKKSYVSKRIITGPTWDIANKKSESRKKKEEDNSKFYLSHTDFKVDGKNFIDLGRQTHRASFTSSNNIRLRSIKSSNPVKRTESPLNYKASFYSDDEQFQLQDARETNTVFGDSNKKGSAVLLNQTQSNNKKWIRSQAPDFRKTISREQKEKIFADRRTVIPFTVPNYKLAHSSN